MHQRPPKKRLRAKVTCLRFSTVGRILFFFVVLLAALVTGMLAVLTGTTSTPTLWSGLLALLLAVVAVIQIYPILVSPPSQSGSSTPMPTLSTLQRSKSLSTQTSQPSFFPNLPLRDPREFYGRAVARTTLLMRIFHGGSCSIVGERRQGKTWLLDYARLIVSTHSTPGLAYRVACVSATHPQCKSLVGFVGRVLEEFMLPAFSPQPGQPPLTQLSRGVRNLKNLGIVPVLGIDEFDGIANKQEFTSEFVDGLRALTQDDGLVLITASRQPLKKLIEDLTGETSPLFNIVQQISLHPFTEQEARDFVDAKSALVGFSEEERECFLRWGTLYTVHGGAYWPPLRLQLVGQMLLDERQTAPGAQATLAADKTRAQNEFKARLDETYQSVVRQVQ